MLPGMLKHKYISRKDGLEYEEDTFGGHWIEWGYQNPIGRQITSSKLIQKAASLGAQLWMDSPFSKSRIENFVRIFKIRIEDFKIPLDGYKSFNDFFIRELQDSVRKFPEDPKQLGAPAEGRLSVYALKDLESELYFKGDKLSIEKLLGGDTDLANIFVGGWAFVFRLCPVDYHRFHFCATGAVSNPQRVSGKLHSVNPLSLSVHTRAFVENERQVTIQDSKEFGKLAYVEVGAMCVGRIVQTFNPSVEAQKGQEKGFFEFGGSTVILLCTSKLNPSSDLIENSKNGLETLVELGNVVATSG